MADVFWFWANCRLWSHGNPLFSIVAENTSVRLRCHRGHRDHRDDLVSSLVPGEVT